MKQLEDYRKEAWNCYRDSMCKFVFTWHVKSERFARMCPSLMRYQFDAFSSQGRLDIARAIIEGELEWSDRLLDVVYRCQLCGGCDYVCGRVKEIQPGKIIQAMRARLVADGKAPPAEFKPLMASLKDYQTPYQQPNANKAKWLREFYSEATADVTIPEGEAADTVLFVGCSPLRDAAAEAMPKTALKLLMKAGVNVGVLGDREKCCGNPSLRMGDQAEFVAFARENIKQFNELGVKKLVCICPFCYSTFRRDYPEVGEKMNFEVVHILEVVDRLIKDKKLKPRKARRLTVTYHDPCHLGRISSDGVSGTNVFTGLYDVQRSVLGAIPGVELVEMERIRDDSLCCGAGSWMRNAYPDFAEWTALERITEARTTGAEALVTYCPHCEENLEDALKSSGSDMKLYDLLELVLGSL
ncbi:MAG: (Fe-S)-binding protein [Chloroflexota bacterium]